MMMMNLFFVTKAAMTDEDDDFCCFCFSATIFLLASFIAMILATSGALFFMSKSLAKALGRLFSGPHS